MCRTVAVIGNGTFSADCTEEVNSCEEVFRFNLCGNFNVMTGVRTTTLCIANRGSPARDFALRRRFVHSPAFKMADRLLFTSPKLGVLGNLRTLVKGDFERVDYAKWLSATNRARHKERVYLDDELYSGLVLKLANYGELRGRIPSSGALVIEFAVRAYRSTKTRILVGGFSHLGWVGHPWELEAALVKDYLSRGVIEHLEPNKDGRGA